MALRAIVDAGHDVALVVTRPDKRRGRHEPPRPSPGQGGRPRAGPAGQPPGPRTPLERRRRAGRGRGLRPHHQEGGPRPPAARQRPFFAAAPVAGGGAGRARHPGGRHHHRGVPHGDRRGPRHRPRLPLRAGGDRARGDRRGAAQPLATLGASMLVGRAVRRPGRADSPAGHRRPTPTRSSRPTCSWTGTGPPRSCTGWCAWDGPGRPGGAGACWCWPPVSPISPSATWPPGQLQDDVVVTGDGGLRLITVQPEGRSPMAASDWLRGARPRPEQGLGS